MNICNYMGKINHSNKLSKNDLLASIQCSVISAQQVGIIMGILKSVSFLLRKNKIEEAELLIEELDSSYSVEGFEKAYCGKDFEGALIHIFGRYASVYTLKTIVKKILKEDKNKLIEKIEELEDHFQQDCHLGKTTDYFYKMLNRLSNDD